MYPKGKKFVMCLLAQMLVLDKLLSDMSYRIVSYKFSVNESTTYIKYGIFKQKHTQNMTIHRSVVENVVTKVDRNLTLYLLCV